MIFFDYFLLQIIVKGRSEIINNDDDKDDDEKK